MNSALRFEYITLLMGDILVLASSLWITLLLRYGEIPSDDLLQSHYLPFSLLFAMWIVVFFLAGLYDKQTRLFKRKLPSTILWTQGINIMLAAMFFWFMPSLGIAPRANLIIYLFVSVPLIFIWRLYGVSILRGKSAMHGVIMGQGPDMHALADEIQKDKSYQLLIDYVVDTDKRAMHEIVRHACQVTCDQNISFVIVDFADKAVSSALPIIYDAAFKKKNFALVDIVAMYQEVFNKVPLSFLRYEWILWRIGRSQTYDLFKRILDIFGALIIGMITLVIYPFVMMAIFLDDRGHIFITQERVGKHQRRIFIYKFRTMTGNDNGKYGLSQSSNLRVTRVGKWLRILRIDELPQLWNVLMGDLSLVGPRPELPSLSSQYNARIPYYSARCLLTPGLTGWAQIKHDRHPHHGLGIEETKEKLSYDMYYLSRRSLLLDVYILFQTIRIVITCRGV